MGPAIDQVNEEIENLDVSQELEENPLMQQINESKLKVIARVVGIIKKFSKTYGGSILSSE